MMIIKGQGLMSEEEARALLDKYDVYVERRAGNTKLGMEGKSYQNVLYYTIDPADYNYLMNNKISGAKPKLFIQLKGGNTFSFDYMKIEFKLAFPYNIVKNLGFNTKNLEQHWPISAAVSGHQLAENDTLIDDSFTQVAGELIQELGGYINSEEHLDIKNFEVIFLSRPGISMQRRLQDIFSGEKPVFTVRYNFKPTFDKYTKSRNVELPDSFTDGFEKYFAPLAIKELVPRFRKFIYRRGKRTIPRFMSAEMKEPSVIDIYMVDLEEKNYKDALYILTNFVERTAGIELSSKVELNLEVKPLDESIFVDMKNIFLDLVGLAAH